MVKMRSFFVLLCAFVFGAVLYSSACTPEPPKTEKPTGGEKVDQKDGGQIKDDVTPVEKDVVKDDPTVKEDPAGKEDPIVKEDKPAGPIDITFDPKDGAKIGVDGEDACIKVQFSSKPCSKGKKAELKREGASVGMPVSFEFDPKDRTKAKVCALGLLRQGQKYTLKVEVSENVKLCADKGKKYSKSAMFTTKEPYKGEKPADAGIGINLKLKEIVKPAGVKQLLGGLGDDKIPPILVNLHSRDKGSSGNLVFVGGLGKGPAGGKPHQGKDVIDASKTPVSLALIGKFNGRAFYVGPTTFVLAVAGLALRLDDFSLTGVFTKDAKNVEYAKLTGIIDPKLLEKQFGLNICQLLAGECYKGPDGKDRLLLAGSVVGVENPFPFSSFVTTPVYLSTGFDPATKVIFYTTKEVKEGDLKFTLSSCKGSSDKSKPCDTSKGAVIAAVSGAGKIELNANKKQGLYTLPTGLDAATWYKLEFEAKDATGAAFKTFTIFETK